MFFVDGTTFVITVSRQMKFVTVEHTPIRTTNSLMKHLKRVLQVYHRAGFTVRYVMMDGEFDKVKDKLPSMTGCYQDPIARFTVNLHPPTP